MAQLVISNELFILLSKLAKEDGLSPEQMVARLAHNEDEERHLIYRPGVGHVRVKCNRHGCTEKADHIVTYGD